MVERLVTMQATASPSTQAWQRPKGLLLDAMGTLITLRQSVGQGYAAVAGDHGVAVSPDAIDAAFPIVYRQAPALAFGPLQGEALEAAERQWWGARIGETFAAIGAPRPELSLQHALFDHFAQGSCWQLYPEVNAQLRQWRQNGLKLAVVSNFDRRLHGLLEELGVRSLLDAVVVSSEAGAAKPDPKPFELALEALSLRSDEAWHIGDSPEDLAGAKAAGVPCVLVQRDD